jgi:hypothetical protein
MLVWSRLFSVMLSVAPSEINKSRSKTSYRLAVWSLVVLLGLALVGLSLYANSYQGEQIPCPFLFQLGPCYSHPYAVYELPLLSLGFLVILWGSAYVVTIIGSRKNTP